jgi:hypothetical protein
MLHARKLALEQGVNLFFTGVQSTTRNVLRLSGVEHSLLNGSALQKCA